MAKSSLKTVKNWIVNSEDDFVGAARTINGIVVGLQSWHNRYGKKQYYNGLKSARWDTQSDDWMNRLNNANLTLHSIYDMLQRSKKIFTRKNVSSTVLDTIIDRVVEKRELIAHLQVELQDIYKMSTGYSAEDPINRYTGEKDESGKSIVNEEYKSMTKAMEKEHRAQVDSFCHFVSDLSTIQSMYYVLSKQVVPLLDRKITEMQQKEDKIQSKEPKTFKDQLVDFQNRLTKEQEDNNSYNKWVTQQYKTLERFSATYNHLLTEEETFGVCELPIVLVNSYLNEAAVKNLVWAGYNIDRLLGTYLIVENALLLGIQSDNNEDGLQKSTYVWRTIQDQWNSDKNAVDANLINKVEHLSHIFNKSLVPIGPLVRKGIHLYAWLIPHTIIQHRNSGFVLKEWDIQLSK